MNKISNAMRASALKRLRLTAGACAAAMLCACGGGADGTLHSESALMAAPQTSAPTTLVLDAAPLPDAAAAAVVRPMFAIAPALLAEPDDDAADGLASARRGPHRVRLSADEESMPTRRLTVQAIRKAMQARAQGPAGEDASVAPMASGTVIATYTPAQIRAAYDLPALPPASVPMTAAQRAQLGAGQTIYIVNANHNPNVAAELAAFNQRFSLPACTVKPIAATLALPMAPAAVSAGCELSVVYSTAAGAMTGAVPAYDSGWATEIALDVQWAHATAPLARIVLIEAADASVNNLLGGVKLANAMGAGVVSMSFGAAEGNWTASVDSAFAAANMTYLAATGDSGAAVSWPSVSSKVLAVGGTTLSWSGSGARSEAGWSGTGGGTSAYVATPAYQNNTVPGVGMPLRRTVADVAFNADPSSGQFVAVMAPGSAAVSWVSAGGTSLATPQWAGLVALANAQRALTAKAALGAAHTVLYGQIGAVPAYYASAFADVVKGANGTCGTCVAKVGHDTLAGLGTPNVNSMLQVLSGAAVTASAPVVTPAAISGKVGAALTFTVAASAANPLTYSLAGAPSGMVISTAGVVTWPVPLAGTYAVTLLAKDSKTGLTGQGVYTVNVAAAPAPVAPVVTAASVTGKPGVALAFTVAVAAPNPVTYALSGAPAGMAIDSAGAVTWAKPVLGSYNVTVVAKDSKTGLSGQAVIKVNVAVGGPTITAAAMTGVAGKPMSGNITLAAPGATSISVTVSGAPAGMAFSMSGLTITALWANPQAGSYTLTVVATDSAGLTAKATVPVVVTAK
ncbi:MAG: peptidase [Massilia sp.]|nr:peptidase [Massilia sp.]